MTGFEEVPTAHALMPTSSAIIAQKCVRIALTQNHFNTDSLAEWSKALASGASPQGRGFEPHSCQ